ncbi:amidohydrolase family protein [Modestobacter sp. VKM Ac-2978]|uniref:amidohydrolase family protein n=1 Tax=Modestobacter sp. VKM Ac-2978 TaxID=3004132 RepID=UPI0022AB1A78|nr:amidohydrolase family protein [Modestobacter sp. VKM Ac-2978]MCZ2850298.1 amidohydrolase family protein [Modestobacter sp. VKM Ac-2978]
MHPAAERRYPWDHAGARAFGGPLADTVADLALVDHHVHGALRTGVDRPSFESMITEAPRPSTVATQFDSQIGFAIRRWCAPVLGLQPHASADDYWHHRSELGEEEVNRRLLRASGTATYLIETGYLGDAVLSPEEHADVAAASAREVVRLETVAESLLDEVDSARAFVAQYPSRLAEATSSAVGTKSILAYRFGFDVDAARPGDDEVVRAVERVLGTTTGRQRIEDPVLLRHLLWCGVDRGLPIQLHSGYGDPDLDLHRANPLLLAPWLREVEGSGVPVMLLHNYPYHREAGYLAQVFDNVYFDVGLGLNYVGSQSPQLIAESLELAPFHKQLYSSDAWGPSELHFLGSLLWRRGISRVVGQWVQDGDWSQGDAERVLRLIAHENAERVYRL